VRSSISLVVSIKRPATLSSALQINGEDSLFSPDFVSPTLKALFTLNNIAVKPVQTYFLDSVYRPDPKQYYPDEQILQFTLASSAKK